MYRQSEKKLVRQQYLLHISPQYGELQPTSGWDCFVSLGHPCKFQRISHLGSVTAQHSSSGRQPNFAALNRGRHLYSVGWSSRWALAHISSVIITFLLGELKMKTWSSFHKTVWWLSKCDKLTTCLCQIFSAVHFQHSYLRNNGFFEM